jgi:hypothetical protein
LDSAQGGKVTHRIDTAEIRRALELVLAPGQVTEMRALNCTLAGERRSGTFSGYYNREHIDRLIADVQRIASASGVYFTPNPIQPALLARSPNSARIIRDKEPTTSDKDVLQRHWLLIDVDPVRPAGISSTASEKAAAEGVATAIDYWAWERGWKPGIIADSGNGCHLLLPCNLPADDGRRVERLLKMFDAEFSTPAAKVDVTTFNPARIWRLYGSLACKGADAPDLGRPWRVSRILQVCQPNRIEEGIDDAARS